MLPSITTTGRANDGLTRSRETLSQRQVNNREQNSFHLMHWARHLVPQLGFVVRTNDSTRDLLDLFRVIPDARAASDGKSRATTAILALDSQSDF